jgi:hypothetical protein
MKTFLIRGVPLAVQQDGWWLNGPPVRRAGSKARDTGPEVGQLWLLLALIALADQLVWGVAAGVSLAVFGLALVMAVFVIFGPALSAQRQGVIAALTVLVLLPLVEVVQPLSVVIAAVGLTAVFCLLAGLRPQEVARGAMRIWPLGAVQTVRDGLAVFTVKNEKTGAQEDFHSVLVRLFMGWAVPLLLGVVFLGLLLMANPIATGWINSLSRQEVDLPDGWRVAFWLALAPIIWTVLSLGMIRERLRLPGRAARMGPARAGVINPASVTRALVMFNAMFAVQTGMDVVYLYGGVGLPDGITYAEYAHRGAYPLVVTALLAGGFALLTRAWVQGDQMLRVLLLVFVAQNVALVCSAVVRLELYISVYGLTHLRMAAGIWMGMVAGGLAMILWQVWQNWDTRWLSVQICAMAAAVLYGCAWVSFDATIARYNLAHLSLAENQQPASGYGAPYLCLLGDAAVPVLLAHDAQICNVKASDVAAPKDWREWGFRNARARHSLALIQAKAKP